jgi:uncharacterized protein (TIGR02246 family)
MTQDQSRTRDREESAIRAAIESWASALRAKDVEAVLAHYAPDVVSFDLAPPLEHRGVDAIRQSLQDWFPTFRGRIGMEVHELQLTVGDDAAFAHALHHLTGDRTTEKERTDVWFRSTTCFRKLDGRWKVTHEHSSVPFRMDGSYRAAVDLKPEGAIAR